MSQSKHPGRELRILGEALRQVRERRDVSIEELSSTTGVSAELIAALEAGRMDPSFELLLTLTQGMDMRLSVLFSRVEELEGD